MDWRDQGMVLSAQNHGETSVIIEVFTERHGRHAGIVRGGMSRKLKPVLQTGNQVSVEWTARLEEHLGAYRVEPVKSRAAAAMANRMTLEGYTTVSSMLRFAAPEREAMPELYAQTMELADEMERGEWLKSYVLWELALLGHLGYGLDLTSCAVTGGTGDLEFVSPKTGRAVTRAGAGDWVDQLLPLPAFLATGGPADMGDVCTGLRLTGHFLKHHLAAALGKADLPPARHRLLNLLEKRVRASHVAV